VTRRESKDTSEQEISKKHILDEESDEEEKRSRSCEADQVEVT
jgi:hypothetical protein